MKREFVGLVLAGLGVALVAGPAGAQQTEGAAGPLDWTGQIAAGGRLRIADVHGDIRVTAATGDRVVVHADVRHGGHRRGDIVFDVVPEANNVTICARWSDASRCSSEGLRDDDGDHENGGGSASADFTVQLPRTLRLDAETGNGAVEVSGTGTDVAASSGNGI